VTFASQLKSERARLGLTQAEAAVLLDVSPRAVWQWEKGEEPLALTQEAALARLKKAKKLKQSPQARRHSSESPIAG